MNTETNVSLQEMKAQLLDAESRLESARDTAVKAKVHLRDLDYCREAGILTSEDQDFIDKAREQRTRACIDLLGQRQFVVDLSNSIISAEKEAAEKRQRAWMSKHHPELLAEVEAAEAQYTALIGVGDSVLGDSVCRSSYADRFRAQERLSLAKGTYENTYLATYSEDGGGTDERRRMDPGKST